MVEKRITVMNFKRTNLGFGVRTHFSSRVAALGVIRAA